MSRFLHALGSIFLTLRVENMIWIFWLALAFLAYTFVGYSMLLRVLGRFRSRPHRRAPIYPKVTVIIAAHNEAKGIGRKIENTLGLEYPDDRWEIIVVSDASTDGTPEIVRAEPDPKMKLIEYSEHHGKQYGQRAARDSSCGEILVFTDVAAQLPSDALQKIVSNFADPSVGCVSSEDRVLAEGQTPGGEGSYVDFEIGLRRLESRVNSLIGVSGSFFAARREVCEKWHCDQTSDFFVPLHAAERGLRTVTDPEAIGYYRLVRSGKDELPRKVRTIAQGLFVFFTHLKLSNPFRYGFFSLQLVSHKLFRWLVPFALLVLLISNLLLWRQGFFYQVCLLGQLIFYGMGFLGYASEHPSLWKPVRVAAFFSMANWATLVAWFKYLKGETYVTWRPSQR